MVKIKRKHPLQGKKLRRAAGQSLQKWINERIYGSTLPLVTTCAGFAGMTCMTICQWLFKTSPQPFVMSVVCLGLTAYTIYKVNRDRKEICNRSLGLDGERWMGQFLEQFKTDLCDVFHDIPCSDSGIPLGNVDHILICDRGVFVVETKMKSKTDGVAPEIIYDSQTLYFGKEAFSTGEIEQARRLRRAVEKHLRNVPGLADIMVKAIVVYPGWCVKAPGLKFSDHDVWVLSPPFLENAIGKEPARLSPTQVRQAIHEVSQCQQAECMQ